MQALERKFQRAVAIRLPAKQQPGGSRLLLMLEKACVFQILNFGVIFTQEITITELNC
jgi:hypothetical protein